MSDISKEEIQKRVEFLGASLIINGIGAELSTLIGSFVEIAKKFFDSLNEYKKSMKNDKIEKFKKIISFFVRLDEEIYNALEKNDIDSIVKLDNQLKNRIREYSN